MSESIKAEPIRRPPGLSGKVCHQGIGVRDFAAALADTTGVGIMSKRLNSNYNHTKAGLRLQKLRQFQNCCLFPLRRLDLYPASVPYVRAG